MFYKYQNVVGKLMVPKDCFLEESRQAFEHLLERQLIEFADTGHNQYAEFCSVKQIIAPSDLHQRLKSNCSCPVLQQIFVNYANDVCVAKRFRGYLELQVVMVERNWDNDSRTIFNANKEIVLMALRKNDVYVIDMSSMTPNRSCFFAKALESVNCLWHKRLSHLNFKNINKFAKQNKVLDLPSLVYSKDNPFPKVTRSQITHHASTSSYLVPQDRWSRDQHIKLENIIGKPIEGMLTRSMASKLTAPSASECLSNDFLFEIEPKKVFKALKHPGWVDAMQEELNPFYRNKVWTLIQSHMENSHWLQMGVQKQER
uniref:Origin of replication complex subunit 4 n=1 Tax=Tanacetum cinerariifolium TaxID=118510 RepID=A0A6L2MKN1_TANCI|nr:origin of replication complex subunit 4 [Tanacetum cinerariifolium]